jgi:hypothetical protein
LKCPDWDSSTGQYFRRVLTTLQSADLFLVMAPEP